MSDTVIKVQNLSKRYRIGGAARIGYKTIRETIVDTAKAPFQRLVSSLSALHSPRSMLSASGSSLSSQRDDHIWALKDVSFEVNQGEVVGIIGRNGAGKSTLLKILSKITEPTEGRVELSGRVGSLLEVGTGFHPELTGHENVYMYGAILGMDRWEITRKFDEIVAFAELEKFIETPVKRYSSGMYMRLAFAVAAHMETEILLVDEVLAVGDAAFQKKCMGKMGDVSKEGRTILFVSHNMAAIQSLCAKGMLLEKGHIHKSEAVDAVVNTYMRELISRDEGKTKNIFPVHSRQHEISINSCSCILERGTKGGYNLKIEIEIEAGIRMRNVGVGISLTSVNGVKVCVLGPAVTNYIIDELSSNCKCILYCRNIGKYLAGGDYILGVWLARPRIEY
ncbi:ABC transporter ATP-binding protein, partial [candidate division KSB1 bacterium]|nr:ABC transporter ATP-binding protein [candidate division KSB1 bacterium]